MEERILMIKKDLHRFEILTGVQKKYIKKVRAAQILGISTRQIQRLMIRLKEPRAMLKICCTLLNNAKNLWRYLIRS